MFISKHLWRTGSILALAAFGPSGLMAQGGDQNAPKMRADADPVFEVATIKPSQFPGVSLKLSPSGVFESSGTTLSDLIKLAYDLHPRQIVGGPSWMEAEKYDVTGKPDQPGEPSLFQLKAMIRKLLADRFQLTVRQEKRELPVYAITIAKSGSKLVENHNDPNGVWAGGIGARSLSIKNITMAEFANLLDGAGQMFDRPLVDQTGLGSARYDLTMKWTPLQAGGADHAADSSGAPDLFTAFQEQLGLKLEARPKPRSMCSSSTMSKNLRRIDSAVDTVYQLC